jgi:hypothetical protein
VADRGTGCVKRPLDVAVGAQHAQGAQCDHLRISDPENTQTWVRLTFMTHGE